MLQRLRAAIHWRTASKVTPELRAWRLAEGDRTLRLDYDLGPESVVLDVGGFEGQWASDIVAMYGCRVYVFEPHPDYANRIERRFARQPLVTVHKAGLAAEAGTALLSEAGDASSHVRNSGGTPIDLLGVENVFDGLIRVDLMKLNIEGAEYDLLDRMIDTGLIARITDLQVQFHDVIPNAEARLQKIREGLSATHRPTYSYRFVWENWRRV
jgi:FkbM family methyltransferase